MKEDCPLPQQRVTKNNSSNSWYLFVAIVLGIVVLTGLLAVRHPKISAPDDSVTVKLKDVTVGTMETREQAALEMLRLGADRWMLECAYEQGRQGVSRETMLQSCAVDWELSALD